MKPAYLAPNFVGWLVELILFSLNFVEMDLVSFHFSGASVKF